MAEGILHFGGVRLRATGSGSLRMQYRSLDSVYTKELSPLTLQSSTAREPTVICNFKSQRGFLKLYTTGMDEQFEVNLVVQYVKPIYDSFAS